MMTRNENLKTYSIKEIPHYHIYGRTDETQNLLPLFWNGSGIEVNVTGSELWIDLDVDCSFHEPWIATELNGAFMSRQMLLPGSYSICLFRSMTFGVPKTMKFFRELQAMSEDDDCHVFVRGFRCDGEFLPVKEHKYKIEFIGDSITSGEGTYGALPDTDWLAMYMSSSENYATYTAKVLDADYRLISQGGWGVYCGWDNDVRHNIPSCYEKICGLGFGEVNESVGAQKDYDLLHGNRMPSWSISEPTMQVHLISLPSLFRKPAKPSSSTRTRTEASWKKTGNALKMPYTISLKCFVRTTPEHTLYGPTVCSAMI